MIQKPIVAIQADPLESLKASFDTSLMLAGEAALRGYSSFAYTPADLVYNHGEIYADGRFFTVDLQGNITHISATERLALSEAAFVLVRQNPPYDMAYLTALDILANLPASTRVLNNPMTLRSWGEKIIPLQFKDICPRTCITSKSAIIHEFIAVEKTIILKPLYGFGGADVFILTATDANCDAIIDMMCARYPFGVIAQEFLPEVITNDRRLLMIDGKLKAVFKRTPKAGTIRGNVAVGGTAAPCDVSAADHMIAERLAAFLLQNDIMLAGVDAVGDRLIEVNITSPTGLRIPERLYGQNLAKDFWDAVITK
ncbi:MAG: glutathione synthase [Pseudomonadota bacterium]